MFSKEKSKEILKLKYLWLVPVLIGMLVYTSCENTETEKVLPKVNEKRLVKLIMRGHTNKDGTVVKEKIIQTEREGYFDMYLFGSKPEGKEISASDLSSEEKMYYEDFTNNYREDGKYYTYKLFELDNGSRAIQEIVDWKGMKNSWKSEDYFISEEVPFAAIDQVPVFPGCEDTDDPKACMVDKITEFVSSNFNMDLGKDLGLEKGKKKVYVQFTINKTGKIVNVRARGPHEDLETEAIRVVSQLPQMIPGKNNGKKVGVKYTLPISFIVE